MKHIDEIHLELRDRLLRDRLLKHGSSKQILLRTLSLIGVTSKSAGKKMLTFLWVAVSGAWFCPWSGGEKPKKEAPTGDRPAEMLNQGFAHLSTQP